MGTVLVSAVFFDLRSQHFFVPLLGFYMESIINDILVL